MQDSAYGTQEYEEEEEDIVSELQKLEIKDTDMQTKRRVLLTIFERVDEETLDLHLLYLQKTFYKKIYGQK